MVICGSSLNFSWWIGADLWVSFESVGGEGRKRKWCDTYVCKDQACAKISGMNPINHHTTNKGFLGPKT
jgi:hypothetical protein